MATPPERFDLVILGGGSAAFSAAAMAAAAGRTVAIVEERSPGGTCPNHGCVPSKFLIEAAETIHRSSVPRHAAVSAAELAVDFERLIREKDQWVLNRRKHYEHPEQPNVHLFRGHGQFADAHTISVDGVPRLVGDRILIATGARPAWPDIDGLADVPYLSSDLLAAGEPQEVTRLPASMLVVGGGYIALESGQMFHRFGCRVTLLARGAQLLNDGYEPEVRACVRQSLSHEGFEVLCGAEVARVRSDGDGVAADVTVGGEPRTLRAERLLLAVGREANIDGLHLARVGIGRTADRRAVKVDERLRTTLPHVYAAGDPVGTQHGGQQATPIANLQGQVAAHNALGLGPPREVDLRVVPRTIFTDPQVATVGLTEAAARSAGHDVWAGQIPMKRVPRANLMRQADGLCKMVADRATGRVLGVSLVGPQVGEVIHEAAMGLRLNATVDDFADLVHVFPAVAEALKIVAVQMRKERA